MAFSQVSLPSRAQVQSRKEAMENLEEMRLQLVIHLTFYSYISRIHRKTIIVRLSTQCHMMLRKSHFVGDTEELKTTDHPSCCIFTKITWEKTGNKCEMYHKKLFLMKLFIACLRRNVQDEILFQMENAIVVVTLFANHCNVIL